MAQKLENLINKDLLADYDDELKKTYLAGGIVFDISAHKATGSPATPATFAGLAAALGTNGANIPQNMRKGGMTVKFIKGSAQSQSNKYVQYRLKSQTFSTSEADWECIEDSVSALEQAVGTGGSVDERIAAEGAKHYLKTETYTKTEVNGLVDTPHQEYVTVEHYVDLPVTGSADTIYRVSNWDGSADGGQGAVDATVYSEYAWDGVSDPGRYVFLCVNSQIGEVFDISVYNNNAKYADLAAALNGGANIPQSLQKGGMSVKFVQSSDNKYIQARCMAQNFTTDITQWQGVDDKPTTGSNNLVKSGGVSEVLSEIESNNSIFFAENIEYINANNIDANTTYWLLNTPIVGGKKYILSFVSDKNLVSLTIKTSTGQSLASVIDTLLTNEAESSGVQKNIVFTASGDASYLRINGDGGTDIVSANIAFRLVQVPENIYEPITEHTLYSDNQKKQINTSLGIFKISSSDYYIFELLDLNDAFVFGIKKDGGVDWANGVPTPVKKYIWKLVITICYTKDEIDTIITNNVDILNILIKNNRDDIDNINLLFSENIEYINANNISTNTSYWLLNTPIVGGKKYRIDFVCDNDLVSLTIKTSTGQSSASVVDTILAGEAESSGVQKNIVFTASGDASYLRINGDGGTDIVGKSINFRIIEISDVSLSDKIEVYSNKQKEQINTNLGIYLKKESSYLFEYNDSEGHFVFGIKKDGTIDWVIGVPTPIKRYIEERLKPILSNIVDIESSISEIIQILDNWDYSAMLEDTSIEALYPNKKYLPILANLNKKSKLKQEDGGVGKTDSNVTPFVLLHFSDIHGNATNLDRIMKFWNRYKTYIADAIHTGDILTSYYDSNSLNFWLNTTYAKDVLQVIGNHDTWTDGNHGRGSAGGSAAYTEEECFKRFFIGYQNDSYNDESALMSDNPIHQNWGATLVTNKCYYYKDYSDCKVRLIVIDTEHPSAEQNTWFANLLNDIIDNNRELSVVVAMHKFHRFVGIDSRWNTLNPVIDYYTFTDMVQAVNTFINNGGDFVCWLNGHSHRDQLGHVRIGDVEYTNQLECTISRASASSSDNWTDTFRFNDTESQDLFNLFKVDTYEGYMTLFRVGNMYDGHLQKKEVLIYDYRNQKIIYEI